MDSIPNIDNITTIFILHLICLYEGSLFYYYLLIFIIIIHIYYFLTLLSYFE